MCISIQKSTKAGFFPRRTLKPYTAISDKDVVKSYSDSLDQELEDFSNFVDVNGLSEKITISTQSSSEIHIPPKKRSTDNKPWVNESFLRLIEYRNKCKNMIIGVN